MCVKPETFNFVIPSCFIPAHQEIRRCPRNRFRFRRIQSHAGPAGGVFSESGRGECRRQHDVAQRRPAGPLARAQRVQPDRLDPISDSARQRISRRCRARQQFRQRDAATSANPVVLTLNGPAPATGAPVTITYTAPPAPAPPAPAPPPSPWAVVKGPFVATNLGPDSCSIPLDGSGFGPFSRASGTLTIALPYTLRYLCALHPGETGTITVNPQP
jgi:hypothetical protein